MPTRTHAHEDLDPELYLGVIEPSRSGRWVWPFADMKIGEHFHVSKALRGPGSVRNYAGVAASRLDDRTFSVKVFDPAKPGFTLVICKAKDADEKHYPITAMYGAVQGVVLDRHGFNIDQVDWFGFNKVGDRQKIEAPPREAKDHPAVLMEMLDQTFVFEFQDDGFTVERLPNAMTGKQWQLQREAPSTGKSREAVRARGKAKIDLLG